LIDQRGKAYGAVFAFDVEVVFKGDWEAMQWSHKLASSVEVVIESFGASYGFFEECIAKTVRLNLSATSS
jgi:hypothetical protein